MTLMDDIISKCVVIGVIILIIWVIYLKWINKGLEEANDDAKIAKWKSDLAQIDARTRATPIERLVDESNAEHEAAGKSSSNK